MIKNLLAALAILFSIEVLAAPVIGFVDGDNGDDGHSGTGCVNFETTPCATAWKTIHNSAVAFAGSIEYVKASTAPYGYMYLHDLPGTESQPIQFIGVAGPRGAHPLVQQASSGQVGALQIAFNSHYVTIKGFDFYNPPSLNPNGSAALIGSTTSPCTVDHITIEDSIFAWSGGGGISAEYMDYLNLFRNLVHDNGSTITTASPSGISVLAFCNYDNATGWHNVIQQNVVYNEASSVGSPVPSDFNCLINDDQDHYQVLSYTNAGVSPYTGATLVRWNLVFGCQGKGLHDWASENLIVFDGNTVILNCLVPGLPCSAGDGDMDALGAPGHYVSGAVFKNNVVVATRHPLNVSGVDPVGGYVTATCNNFGAGGTPNWDSSGTFNNSNNIAVDPHLVNPLSTPAGNDLRPTQLRPAMPAVCLNPGD